VGHDLLGVPGVPGRGGEGLVGVAEDEVDPRRDVTDLDQELAVDRAGQVRVEAQGRLR